MLIKIYDISINSFSAILVFVKKEGHGFYQNWPRWKGPGIAAKSTKFWSYLLLILNLLSWRRKVVVHYGHANLAASSVRRIFTFEWSWQCITRGNTGWILINTKTDLCVCCCGLQNIEESTMPRMLCNGNGAISHLQTEMGSFKDFRYSLYNW